MTALTTISDSPDEGAPRNNGLVLSRLDCKKRVRKWIKLKLYNFPSSTRAVTVTKMLFYPFSGESSLHKVAEIESRTKVAIRRSECFCCFSGSVQEGNFRDSPTIVGTRVIVPKVHKVPEISFMIRGAPFCVSTIFRANNIHVISLAEKSLYTHR